MDIDFSDFIEWYLQEQDLYYVPRVRGDSTYYISQSPVVEDKTPSFQIFKNGWCESYNANINGKSRLSLKEICKMTGYLKEYIHFVCEENSIPTYKVNEYKDIIISKSLKEKYDYNKYNDLKKVFGWLYISKSDILSIDEIKKVKFNKKFKRKEKKESSIVECDISQSEIYRVEEYLENRKLKTVRLLLDPVKLNINNKFTALAVAIRHLDNCTKYRMISGSLRYLTQGRYKRPLPLSVDEDSKICYMIEGELEAFSVLQIVDNINLSALHNTNGIGSLEGYEKFDKFIFLIDKNTKSKVEKGLIKKVKADLGDEKEVIVREKIDDDKKDYNDLLVEDKKRFKKVLDKKLKI